MITHDLYVGTTGLVTDSGFLDISANSVMNLGAITAGSLNLNAETVTNSGSILSNGAITVNATASINNIAPISGTASSSATTVTNSAAAHLPTILGSSVNLNSQSGSFTNNGIITASKGDVSLSTPGNVALNLNNTDGQLVANQGSINFSNPLTSSSQTLSLIGGNYLAKNAVNINAARVWLMSILVI